jgi:hypothetical protein
MVKKSRNDRTALNFRPGVPNQKPWENFMPDIVTLINRLAIFDLSQEPTTEEITQTIGDLLVRNSRDRIALAVLCGALCLLKKMKPARVTEYLIQAYPDFANEAGWVSRLCRAGIILLEYPELKDQGVDRICILKRLPQRFYAEVFLSGVLPNGISFRELDREALRSEVNKFASEKRPAIQEPLDRKIKRELISLANIFPNLLDQVSLAPQYDDLRLLLTSWHELLIEKLQEYGPRVRQTIYISSSSQVNRATHA